MLNRELVDSGFSYFEYQKMIDLLVSEGKTTGNSQTPKLLEYTKLNQQRTRRLDKTIVLLPDLIALLKTVKSRLTWLVLTEAWCGDAAQNLPAIAKMAKVNDKIELILLLRDQNPELMDLYLTNGGRSIPKLICLETDTMQELGTWGPRPREIQQKVKAYKKDPIVPYAEFVKDVQLWYSRDKTLSVQREFIELLKIWITK
jgi:hypothetical protein